MARSVDQTLVILGASGHGKVVADTARAAGFDVRGFADADPTLRGGRVMDLPVAATTDDEVVAWLEDCDAQLVLAIGNNRVRRTVFRRLDDRGVRFATVVHPSAVVSPQAAIGRGTVVFAGAVIQPGCRVSDDCIVNTAASIDHDSLIEAHAHLSPGVHLGGTVAIGEGAWLGVGVSVRNNLRIGAWTTVGVGAAVVSDLPPEVVAVGVPARPRPPSSP